MALRRRDGVECHLRRAHQAVGLGRRKSYFLQGYDKAGQPTTDKRKIAIHKFPPEYAHIIGVPFKLFKGG